MALVGVIEVGLWFFLGFMTALRLFAPSRFNKIVEGFSGKRKKGDKGLKKEWVLMKEDKKDEGGKK